jgi:hypothetical protein
VHPALRTFRDELKATAVRIFAYVGALAVLAVFTARYFDAPQVRAAIEPATRSDWTVVDRPYRAFELNGLNLPEPDYAIHRHTTGGRKDILTVGDSDGPGSRLMIEIYRPGQENQRFDDSAAAVAERTAELGGPYALKPAEVLAGKFGPMTAFAFTARSAGRARNCLGFVRAFDDPRLQIAGWYCKADAEVVDRRTLACAIEGLSLLTAASEPKVQQLFAAAEQKRTFCAPHRTPRGATTLRRNDWIEGPQGPKLRRSVSAK